MKLTKVCKGCKQELPITAFRLRRQSDETRRNEYYRVSRCRTCECIYEAERSRRKAGITQCPHCGGRMKDGRTTSRTRIL